MQATEAQTHDMVRSALTAMSSAMKDVDGGRPAQLAALQKRITWKDGNVVELTLPVLCFALPPKRFDLAYKSKRSYTELGRRTPMQVFPLPLTCPKLTCDL